MFVTVAQKRLWDAPVGIFTPVLVTGATFSWKIWILIKFSKCSRFIIWLLQNRFSSASLSHSAIPSHRFLPRRHVRPGLDLVLQENDVLHAYRKSMLFKIHNMKHAKTHIHNATHHCHLCNVSRRRTAGILVLGRSEHEFLGWNTLWIVKNFTLSSHAK